MGATGKHLTLAPASRVDSILFVCGRNQIRSPMAEALSRALLPSGVYLASAGIMTGERDPFVDAVLEEKHLALGAWKPRLLDDVKDDYFDLIVTLSPEAHEATLAQTRGQAVEVEFWPTMDPSLAEGSREQMLGAYRSLRDGLEGQIRRRFKASETSILS